MLKGIVAVPVLVVFSAVLRGQDPAGAPARVARLSYVEGSVGLQAGGAADWTEAVLNYPLSTGDRLWTDSGHAEVRIDAAAVHLAPQTAFSIVSLDERVFQMSCSQGAMNVRILRANDGDVLEVDTPNGAISLLGPGSYRIDVDPAGALTTVAVRTGAAQGAATGQSFRADAGQVLRLSGDDGIADLLELNAPDAWDQWCQARDEAFERDLDAAAQYVPWQMVGVEDLSQNGDWEIDVTFGPCWTPRDVPWGWNPYAHGRWIHRWGWTWADDARWGFAPFHYGRWVHHRGLWRWVPGPRSNRPYFSPALVAFVNPRHAGRIGWVPLGPGEAIGQKAAYLNRDHVIDVKHEEFGAAPNRGKAVQPPRRVFERAVMTRSRFSDRTEPGGSAVAITPPARGRRSDGGEMPVAPGRRSGQPEDRQAVDLSRVEEQRRRGEQQQAEDRRRRQEQDRAIQQQRRVDEERRADEQRRAEEQRQADGRRRADQQRRAEEQRSFRQERPPQEQRRVEAQPRWQPPARVEPPRQAEPPARQESKSNDASDRRGRR